MADKRQTYNTENFKIKLGVVDDVNALQPEQGAMAFDKATSSPYCADGVNWLSLSGAVQDEAISLLHEGAIPVAVTAGVPVIADWFDEVVYNIGTAFTESIPAQTVTINTTGSYSYYTEFQVEADTPNVLFSYYPTINWVRQTARTVTLTTKNKPEIVTYQIGPSLNATDVIEVSVSADKTCTVTGSLVSTGIRLI